MRISTQASKFIAKRDRKTQEEIAAAFRFLENVSPFRHSNPKTIRALHGKLEGYYRFKIGDIRIVYAVNPSTRIIEIVNIDNRGDVYK